MVFIIFIILVFYLSGRLRQVLLIYKMPFLRIFVELFIIVYDHSRENKTKCTKSLSPVVIAILLLYLP